MNNVKSISKKKKSKSIYKELDLLSIPDNIKIKTDEIYASMKITVKRGQPRKQMIFSCICYAYREMKIPHNQRKIAKIVNLDTDKISEAFKLFSYIKTGYKPHQFRQTYKDHIPLFYHFTGLTLGEENNIYKIGKIVMENNDLFQSKDPVCFAGALIIYYMQIRGLPENNDIYVDICLTHTTVNNIVSDIALAYNR